MSFASPASRVLKDRPEDVHKSAQLPFGSIPKVLHPSFEEKEVFFRPFSRSTQNVTLEEDRPRYVSEHSPRRKESSSYNIKSPTIDNANGKNELFAARKRLRPVTKLSDNEQKAEKAEKADFTMDDLGNLLDHAIEQQTETEPVAVKLEDSTAEQHDVSVFTEGSQTPTPMVERHPDGDYYTQRSTASTSPKSMSTSESRKPSNIAILPGIAELELETNQRVDTKTHTTSITPNMPVRSLSTVSDRRGSLFRRFRSQERPDDIAKRVETPTAFLNQATSMPQRAPTPMKAKAAIYEARIQHEDLPTDNGSSPPLSDQQHKGSWSPFQDSSVHKFTRPAGRFVPRRQMSSGKVSFSTLIPLRLPQMVSHENIRNGSIKVHGQSVQNSPGLPNHQDEVVNTDQSNDHMDRSESPNGSEVFQSAPESMIDQAAHAPEAVQRDQNSRKPRSQSRPSRWALLERNRASEVMRPLAMQSGLSCAPPGMLSITTIPAKKLGTVESRIKELMAASKQKEIQIGVPRRSTIDVGTVTQRTLFEGVQDRDHVDGNHVPSLSFPIDRYTDEMRAHPHAMELENSSIPTKAQKKANLIDRFGCEEEDETPIKNTTNIPSTPFRGRPRKVKEHLSPHGKPYAIEQRFSLSPSRSRSRHNGSGVFVSVEIRSSPERGRNADGEHEVIVRASVEPDDVFEEAEQ